MDVPKKWNIKISIRTLFINEDPDWNWLLTNIILVFPIFRDPKMCKAEDFFYWTPQFKFFCSARSKPYHC